MLVKTKKCHWCGKDGEVDVDPAGYRLWQEGAYVQVAFPGMPADVREMFISGTHPACWIEMFPPEED